MDVEFDDEDLDALEIDPKATGYQPAVIKGYRKVLNAIRSAVDERDLLALRGLRFEKLQGKRAHQCSFRLNDQWRLIVEIRGDAPRKRIGVVEIVDYH
jgi:proteic killer suppression protein